MGLAAFWETEAAAAAAAALGRAPGLREPLMPLEEGGGGGTARGVGAVGGGGAVGGACGAEAR